MIAIITNMSSKIKRITGEPYCLINGARKKISADEVRIENHAETVSVEFGVRYSKNKSSRTVNYEATLCPQAEEAYYIYKVPLLVTGKGKLKCVKERYYKFYSFTRRLGNNTFFLLGILALALVIKAVFF